MGLKVEPAYIGQTGYLHPVELDRNLLEGLFTKTGGFRYGDFSLSVGVGTRAIQVGSGRYHVLGVENNQQGGYFVWSDSNETFLLAAAVGNPRIDTILLRIIDDQYGSISGAPRAEFAVVQGVASGSPTARPDSDFNVGGSFYIPGAWGRLGDVRVNVADTGSIPAGQITTANQYVRGPAPFVPCLSSARPSDPRLGDRVDDINTGISRRWNGSGWAQCEPWVSTTTLGSNALNIDIASIPTSMRILRVDISARSTVAGNFERINCRINNSSAGYHWEQIEANGATVTGSANNGSHWSLGYVPGASISANWFGGGHMDFQNWNSQASSFPRATWSFGFPSSAANFHTTGNGTHWTAGPYTSLRFFCDSGSNFLAGSHVRVEGWE